MDKFGDTFVRSRGMVELMLATPESTLDIPFMLDVVDVKVPLLLELDGLEGNNLLVDSVTNHLWNHIITSMDPLRFEDIWKIRLMRKCDYLCVLLLTPIQLFYTMAKLQKLHKQFAHP